jgi:hypothetical protein
MSCVPRSFLVRVAQLCALWAYAVSQPILSFLEGNPDFLLLRQLTTFEALVFAVVLAVGPPLVAAGYAALAGLVSRWVGDALFLAALTTFLVPVGFQLAKALEPTRPGSLLVVTAICVIGLVAYVRVRAARSFLTVSVALPVASVAWFLHGLPVTVGVAEAARVDVAAPAPVVLLVLDELPVTSLETPSGSIDGRRYPSFGRLARDATWYPNATTVHEFTAQAVPAILTGRMPGPGGLPTFEEHSENLFTLLGGSYDFSVHESVTHLCPDNLCPRARKSLPRRVEEILGDVRPSYVVRALPRSFTGVRPGAIALDPIFLRNATASIESFETFLDDLAPDAPAQALHFGHLVLPHKPWRFLPSGREYGFADTYAETSGGLWYSDPWAVEQHLQRHLLQVEYVDSLLGRLLDRLERAGSYDRALVVVVADHGASFRAGHSLRAVRAPTFADIASVPLFVKYPGQDRGEVDLRAARTVDVVPTIADVLGAHLPWRVDGVSLRGPAPARADAVAGGFAGVIRVPMRTVERQNEAIRRRNARWFGQGSDSLYRIGTHTQLLGAPVARSLPDSTTIHVRIDDEAELENVRKASSFVPAHIVGQVDEGRIGTGVELAVAVNGRIRALTRPFLDDGEQSIHAFVPESALVEGANRVEVFAIEPHDGRVRLVRIGASRSGR